ncbi:alpha/beta fold hydrolase [Tabrizicola piscis]|uniref:Alpha/beta fold hydrolase n=1 Tax=Tabrizicola piscis TaxID=2494374 RepID=A0A3S8UAT4_9RHOB|nr:alpha/beta fold hydrolase BchO [Tabrizicola piscis]AZL60703.1 alpha/beta fold hydrolase [Tabrizicola piscis]
MPNTLPPDWPFRGDARQVRARPHDWCVIDHGAGPTALLLHGAGASGHSFRHLIPALDGWRCIVPDLPGQGFTRAGSRTRFGIEPMAEDLATLLAQQGWQPEVVIGHSAGAALALQLSTLIPLRAVVGINAALGQFEGAAGFLFPLLARALSVTPFVPSVISRLWGTEGKIRSLLDNTGSPLDPAGVAQYLTLVKKAAHVDGTLGMMAQWRIDRLMARAPQMTVRSLLLATAGDRIVPPRVSRQAAGMLPRADVLELPGLGHLAHEEDASAVAQAITGWLAR